jgi:hypothetical protein
MSKIVKLITAKPITCACCGCEYEFESGDNVIVVINEYNISLSQKYKILARRLECPNCHYENDLEFEVQKDDEPK